LDETLMDLIRTNFDDLDAARVTNGDSHDHSGGDGAQIPQGGIGASAVGQGELKTAQGEVSTTNTTLTNLTLPGGEYGFYPRVKTNSAGYPLSRAQISGANNSTSYITVIGLDAGGGGWSAYAQQRYIQASPPYMLGDKIWGHFLFLLRNISTGVVVSTYQAEDPPWAYNGKVWLPKDHKDRISEVPHPFADYWDKDPATDGLEIVLVNLSRVDVAKWIADNWKIGKSILEDLGSVIMGRGTDRPFSDYNIPIMPGFTDGLKVITP
jgi:hypothetical protein